MRKDIPNDLINLLLEIYNKFELSAKKYLNNLLEYPTMYVHEVDKGL